MAAIHEHTLKVSKNPVYTQLSCNGIYVALPYSRTAVGVWSLQDITCKPLELTGHHRVVEALCFGWKSCPTLLCSAASDYVIVWNIEKARQSHSAGEQVRGRVVGKGLGNVQYVAFSPEDRFIACCAGNIVNVLDTATEQIHCNLEGHDGMVNCAEFCPHYSSTLVTAGDDRTFKVWDISEAVLLYQSTIISSSPFISLAMSPLTECVAIGSADGQVRVYDLTDGNGFRCLQSLDVDKLVSRLRESQDMKKDLENKSGPITVSSRPIWQRPQDSSKAEETTSCEESSSEAGCSILAMAFTYQHDDGGWAPTPAKLSFLNQDSHLVSELLENKVPMLVVGSTASLVQVNARTLEPCSFTNLQAPLPTSSLMENDSQRCLSPAGSMIISQCQMFGGVNCVIGSMFDSEVHIVRMSHPSSDGISQLKQSLSSLKLQTSMSGTTRLGTTPVKSISSGDVTREFTPEETSPEPSDNALSVLSSAPLVANSPLKAELTLKPKTIAQSSGVLKKSATMGPKLPPGSLNKKGQIMDKQGLVFHDKIRSSGYTQAPRKNMFQPETNMSKKSSAQSRTASRAASRSR